MSEEKSAKRSKVVGPVLRAATVLPLDYDSREEHLVVYFSTGWEELVEILTDPVQAFERRQRLWSFDSLDALPWSLEPPIVARLKNGYGDPRGLGLFSAASTTFLGADMAAAPTPAIFPDGAFIAEFAVQTRTLTIYFFPPAPGLDHARGRFGTGTAPPAPRPRFGGALTTITVGALGSDLQSIHFDIQESKNAKQRSISARTRAEFCVDLMENPFSLIDQLNAHKVISYSGQLMAQGTTIVTKPQPDSSARRDFGIHPPSSPTIWEKFPQITVEGLSWNGWNQSREGYEPTACVCGHASGQTVGDKVLIEELMMKLYPVCP